MGGTDHYILRNHTTLELCILADTRATQCVAPNLAIEMERAFRCHCR
jgi:hypothetical protein